MTTMDSLKSKHMTDWLCITSWQLWSFKLTEDASNQLHAHSDYHLVRKDGSHDQPEQDVEDFLTKLSYPPTRYIPVYTRQKWKPQGDLFYIEHITNPIISVKKDAKQEDEITIMPKMKSLSLVRTEGSNQRLPISR
jgi:hypothetical protein